MKCARARVFRCPAAKHFGGAVTITVEPTSSGGFTVSVRPHRARTVVVADLSLVAEIILERHAKALARERSASKRRKRTC